MLSLRSISTAVTCSRTAEIAGDWETSSRTSGFFFPAAEIPLILAASANVFARPLACLRLPGADAMADATSGHAFLSVQVALNRVSSSTSRRTLATHASGSPRKSRRSRKASGSTPSTTTSACNNTGTYFFSELRVIPAARASATSSSDPSPCAITRHRSATSAASSVLPSIISRPRNKAPAAKGWSARMREHSACRVEMGAASNSASAACRRCTSASSAAGWSRQRLRIQSRSACLPASLAMPCWCWFASASAHSSLPRRRSPSSAAAALVKVLTTIWRGESCRSSSSRR